jgi:hypothetical protein
MSSEDRIEVEKDPTPEKEAGQFQNKDEARVSKRDASAIALLNSKKGYVDFWVGLINPSMNTAFLLCIPMLTLILILILATAFHEKPERFSTLLDHLFKIFTLLVGVVIGAASTRSKE